MKCPACGTEMKAIRKNYKYEEAGLKNVILRGINVNECPKCGEELPELPNINGLHRALASKLIRKQSPLTGEEIKFLRKSMDMKGSDLALDLGVHPVTVSRWENNAEVVGPQSDRLIRAFYLFYNERSQQAELLDAGCFDVFESIAKKLVEKTPRSETILIPPAELVEASF